MFHQFDAAVAAECGIEPAVLFQGIGFWCQHNRDKPDRIKDGRPWVYNSRKGWQNTYPYPGEGSIRSALDKFAAAGLIDRQQFSEGVYSRTISYTLADRGGRFG